MYRYGFNAQERDDEINGAGNSYTAMFWQFDSRLARIWNFDHQKKNSGNAKTKFRTSDYLFLNAADMGNYHASYTGTHAGVPLLLQKFGTGVFEQLKLENWNSFNPTNYLTGPALFFIPPHHDKQEDYIWNIRGMSDAQKEIHGQ